MQFAIQVGGGQVRHDRTGIEAIVADAVLAEGLGFDVVFVPDHYVFEAMGVLQATPAYELFFVMATLAQRTRRITIGSHVACLLFRHPAMHARLFAQIDEASGGRVLAGVGAGWTRAEFTMMGIPFPEPKERLAILDEAVAIMRALWREERVTFAGTHFSVTDAVCAPKPVQPGGPPLMLGGSGAGVLRRAGAFADIVHMIPAIGTAGTTTLEALRAFGDQTLPAKLARVRAAEADAGRASGTVRFASTIFTYAPTESPEQTRTLLGGLSGMFGLSPEETRRHPIVLAGTPEEMAEELRRREATHGLSLLAINFSSETQLRDFGERVLPRMR
ncbi:MAG: LLM class flavin-dependent oxidoreductase [bacterium]|nr:LLM class flavin-dependent oxidoreductase [bacterium]